MMWPAGASAAARSLFALIDADGNGTICSDELKEAAKILCGSDLELDLSKADADGDGVITPEEWSDFINAVEESLGPRKFAAFADNCRAVLCAKLLVHDRNRYVFQEAVAQIWIDALGALPVQYNARGASVPKTHERAVTLGQLLDLGELVERALAACEVIDDDPHSSTRGKRITWETVNMYHINRHFVLALTQKYQCSFVDLVASGAQPPRWFVSHAWSTLFKDTLSLLRYHAEVRGLPESTAYWICTFANNQHNLVELGSGVPVTESPFARAIRSEGCEGTVMLLDESCTPFTRIWCILECSIMTSVPDKHFDLAAMIPPLTQWWDNETVESGPAVRIDHSGPRGQVQDMAKPEGGSFPWEVSMNGVRTDVAKAQASREADRNNILAYVEREEGGAAKLGRTLQVKFAGGAMSSAILDNTLCSWLAY